MMGKELDELQQTWVIVDNCRQDKMFGRDDIIALFWIVKITEQGD